MVPIMKKIKILSGAKFLFVSILDLCLEICCLLLFFFANAENALKYTLLALVSIVFVIMLILTNRIVTIVTYDPDKETVTRRGLFWGFHRELPVVDIIRTEIRMIPKEQEYILLLDKEENQYFDSLSSDMPIRVPNNVKGRDFVAKFYSSK